VTGRGACRSVRPGLEGFLSAPTYPQKGDRGQVLGESDEFRRLRRPVEKAAEDHGRAIRNVCLLFGVNPFEALPSTIRTAMLALLDETVPAV
jgi:hypothetical protein